MRLCGLRESEGRRTSARIAEPSFDLALHHGFEKHLFSTGWRVILMASEWQSLVSGASTEKVKRRSRRTPRSTKERAQSALRGREEEESQSRNEDVSSRDTVLEPVACSLEECLLLFGPGGTALNRGGGAFRQDSGGWTPFRGSVASAMSMTGTTQIGRASLAGDRVRLGDLVRLNRVEQDVATDLVNVRKFGR